ncbi:MAG: LacI family DNA-binding transcriptional regulator [Chloroflexi bacterium]|nr:LacI family DNA-binding transcriptional regulator [Chloroflexota bacterium]
MITIREVAKRAGVSVSTASRALNDRGEVSKDVRARVQAAASELHYTANPHARALKGATTKTLGILLAETGAYSFNARLLSGVYDAATPQGYSVIVCTAQGSAEAEREAHQMLLEKRVVGVLSNSVQSGAEPLRRFEAAGIPCVLVNRRLEDLDCDSVVVDYRRGDYLATRHLLQLGHRRILCQLAGVDNPPSRVRLPGYREALEEFDVPFDPDLVLYCHDFHETHIRVGAAMAKLDPQPTAVVAYNDESALPVMKALREIGLRVPQDVSVVGQNDFTLAEYVDPPLTSVAHAVRDMARQATELLLEKINWPEEEPWAPRRLAYEPRLVIRESTCPPLSVAAAH